MISSRRDRPDPEMIIMTGIDRMRSREPPSSTSFTSSPSVKFLILLLFLSGFNQEVSGESETLSPRSVNTKYGALRGTIVYFRGYDQRSSSSSATASSKGSSTSTSSSPNVIQMGSSSTSAGNSQKSINSQYGSSSGGNFLRPVEVFLGVPYATPPVGSLRFMPPVTPTHWRGVRLANKFGPVCPQRLPDMGIVRGGRGSGAGQSRASKSGPSYTFGPSFSSSIGGSSSGQMPEGRLGHLTRILPFLKNQSEDCLYLNIYAPFSAQSK